MNVCSSFFSGDRGRLGTGGFKSYRTPELLLALEGKHIVKIAAGPAFSAAITRDGDVYTWGGNDKGQLGQGIGIAVDLQSVEVIPTKLEFEERVEGEEVRITEIVCGEKHMLAVTDTHRLYFWVRTSLFLRCICLCCL